MQIINKFFILKPKTKQTIAKIVIFGTHAIEFLVLNIAKYLEKFLFGFFNNFEQHYNKEKLKHEKTDLK